MYNKISLSRKASLVLAFLMIVCVFNGMFLNTTIAASKVQATFYVSANGKDTNPGTLLKPFATIQKARDVIRIK